MLAKRGKKGQVTIFIILAIVIIALVGSYFIFKDSLKKERVPVEFQPIYTSFLDCIEEQTLLGISILESQGGHLVLPAFESGSVYMPFSSYLNFMGINIPYWYYISGNNLQKEQVPSKADMEKELGEFVSENIKLCSFGDYVSQGYLITKSEGNADVEIKDSSVRVNLNLNLDISKEEDVFSISNHLVSVDSALGTLYNDAVEIYSQELETMFLENYSIDVLRLYAPVDGVEISCKPLVWNAGKVVSDLKEAVQANTFALKTEGSSKDYFVIDSGISSNARFINAVDWPSTYEIAPADGNLLVAKPIGNQNGLGILGFCYVPYHFVYDMKYPVLIQVYQGNEIFQFPFAIVIDNNMPRTPLKASEFYENAQIDFCTDASALMKISVYDSDLKPVNGEIIYECFGTSCDLGESSQGELEALFPQCVNGALKIKADGFKDYSEIHSIVESGGEIIAILDKEYTLGLDLIVGEEKYNNQAIISFGAEDGSSRSVVYPDQKEITLSEGEYNIQVTIYGNSDIKIENNGYEECVEGYFLGFGKKCYTIEVPENSINYALIGGGKINYYFVENELSNARTLTLLAPELKVPKTLNELQENYVLVGAQDLEVEFR